MALLSLTSLSVFTVTGKVADSRVRGLVTALLVWFSLFVSDLTDISMKTLLF